MTTTIASYAGIDATAAQGNLHLQEVPAKQWEETDIDGEWIVTSMPLTTHSQGPLLRPVRYRHRRAEGPLRPVLRLRPHSVRARDRRRSLQGRVAGVQRQSRGRCGCWIPV